jgi:CBS domain containing-hemolysin-like protein
VGGWIMDRLEKIPAEGDTFEYEHLIVTVQKTESRRVLECIVTVIKSQEGE